MLGILKLLLLLIFGIYLPGRALLSLTKEKYHFGENLAFSLALGIVLLTALVYFFESLRLGLLWLPVLVIFGLGGLRGLKEAFPFRKTSWSFLSLAVIFLGALFQSLLMFKSGTQYQGGLAFWGIHGYDAVWHGTLIEELSHHFPPQNPGFAGEPLKNYHFLADLFYAQIHRLTEIPILDLYFRYAPVLLTLVLNALVYLLAMRWKKQRSIALWSVFFTSIAGSFGWVLNLFGKGSNNWETAFWGIQPTTAFLNPPFAFSLVLLVLGLIFLHSYLEKKTKTKFWLTALIFGLLIGFKVYAGVIILVSLGIFGSVKLLKKETGMLLMTLVAGGIALSLFLPVNSGSANYLEWQPWWFIKTMVEAPDRLNWSSLELRRQVYTAYNDVISLFLLQAFAFLIFLLGNLSGRLFAFGSFGRNLIKGSDFDRFLLLATLLAFLPPLFFTQKVVPWNSIQFLYYFTFLSSFFAAEGLVWLLSRLRWLPLKVALSLVVVAAVLPSTLKTLYWFNAPTPTTLLQKEEIDALKFLKNTAKPEDIFLTFPYGELKSSYFTTYPIPMTYYNSPYVSFMTGHRVYLEDLNAANLLSYNVEERLAKEKAFFNYQDSLTAKNFLKTERINFIYLVDQQGSKLLPAELGLIEIFNNQKVRIYRVDDKI